MIDSKVIPENIARWMSPEVRRAYGKGAITAQEAIVKAVYASEKAQHETVLSWLKRNRLKYEHARMDKRAHDLEPGHPDFTVYFATEFRMYEIKVEGGRLSADQERVMQEHADNQTIVQITGSADDTIKNIKGWLINKFGWQPKEP